MSQIAVKPTVFVGTSGANLITPVVVGLFVYDWRIGLVALGGGLLLIACGRFASSLIASAETQTGHGIHGRATGSDGHGERFPILLT